MNQATHATEQWVDPKANPEASAIEQQNTEFSWLTERWEICNKFDTRKRWNEMANYCHIAAMAIWELSDTQRREYLALSSLADGRHQLAPTWD
jgi:hypothetical protein